MSIKMNLPGGRVGNLRWDLEPDLNRVPFFTTSLSDIRDLHVPPPAAPKPTYPDIEPVNEAELEEYVSNLKSMTKRKRDLQPVIDIKKEELEELNTNIRTLESYVSTLDAMFNTFPTNMMTSKMSTAQDHLKSIVSERIDSHMPSAYFRRTSLEKEILDLTTYLVEMNRAAASASVDPPPKNICPICTDNPIEYVCDPCGHTFCAKCIQHDSYQRRCAMCRTLVPKIIKVFFSV